MRPLDAGSARGGGHVALVVAQDGLEVATLGVARVKLAHLAQRAREVDVEIAPGGGRLDGGALVHGQAALQVVAQLAHVARPGVTAELLEESRLAVREIRPSNLFGYWRLLRCINEKPASNLP